MIKKNKDIKIIDGNIFENDTLNRKVIIEDLSKLIITCNDPFVFSINASWGSGKTTFIKLWEEHLKKEYQMNSIYFSAWEDDFSKEPLVSILGEIDNYINKNCIELPVIANKFKKVKSFGGKVLKRGLPALIKTASHGLLDLEDGIENAISAVTEETTKELIENYSIEKNITKQLKDSLNEVLKEIDSEKPFIIFIDELDRCRPLYAIELLEKIKHVFGIPKLIFILAIDKTQLAESIKSQYGNIDTDNYLRRFIDLEYNLTNPSINNFCDILYRNFDFENLIKLKGVSHNFGALNLIKELSSALKLSPRQIEQLFTKLNILIKTMRIGTYPIYLRICAFFEILRTHNSNYYFQLIENKKNIELFLDEIKDIEKNQLIFIKSLINATMYSPEQLFEISEELKTKLEKTDRTNYDQFKPLETQLYWARYSIDPFGDISLKSLVENVIERIDFIEAFNFN